MADDDNAELRSDSRLTGSNSRGDLGPPRCSLQLDGADYVDTSYRLAVRVNDSSTFVIPLWPVADM